MEKFKQFDKRMSWETKSFFLMALLLIIFSYLGEHSNGGFALSAFFALLVVWVIDYMNIFSQRFPAYWKLVKWAILITVVTLTLIGAILH